MRKKISIHICERHAFTIEIAYKGKQGKLASETAIRNLLLISWSWCFYTKLFDSRIKNPLIMLSNLLENVKYQNFKLFWCNKGSVHSMKGLWLFWY